MPRPALLLSVALAASAPPPHAIEVLREFDAIGGQPLWPGFEPRTIAVEVFDGTSTYLFHHPKPPAGFEAVPGSAGVFVSPGQHESVRANTGTEVNGIPTATADLSNGRAGVREQAALLIHETFHVHEKQAHPRWAANEAELFLYPLDDAELLADRRRETWALVRALEATTDAEAACGAEAALAARGRRAARMPAGALAYERGTELNEGLAQYVEYKAIGKPAALTAADFPVELIRQRGYATGQAWALLLDRFAPGWPARLDGPLDELLRSTLPAARCQQPAGVEGEAERAQRDVAALVASRARRLQDFLSAPGWRLEIVAGQEPLWPQGFDPWNVANLGDNRVLHTRWMKVGNASGSLEALDHASLTEGVGPHPLFNGARRFIVTGLPEPKVSETGGKVTVDAPGVKGTFTGRLERDGHHLVVHVR